MIAILDWIRDARDYFADKLRLRGQGTGRHVLPAGAGVWHDSTEPEPDPDPAEPYEFRYVPDTARLEVHHDFPTPGMRAGYWQAHNVVAPHVIAAFANARPDETVIESAPLTRAGRSLRQFIDNVLNCDPADLPLLAHADKIGLAVRQA